MTLVLVATTLGLASWTALSVLARRCRTCEATVAVESSRTIARARRRIALGRR